MALMNLDAGEYEDEPEELWAMFDVLNIACGGHAGDAASMEKVVGFCARKGVTVGAHPSYPDRANFGRKSMAIEAEALAAAVRAQCAALAEVARRHGQAIVYVKPHGALYHDANKNPAFARGVVGAAIEALGAEITIVGPPAGELRAAAERSGVKFASEGFADRGMRADGSLVPRSEPGALLTEPGAAAAQARELVSSVDTICVHADTPGSLAIARAVHEALHG